jgi:hypothetical protein
MRLLVLILLLGSPCVQAQKCKTYPSKDPSTLRTYSWTQGRSFRKAGWVEDPPSTPIVQREVDQELNKKGYKRVDSGGDMVASFFGSEGAGMQVDTNVDSYYFGPMPMTPIPTTSRRVVTGSIAFTLVDPAKKPIFLAICKDTIDDESQLEKKITKAAEKAFKKFPAAQGASSK